MQAWLVAAALAALAPSEPEPGVDNPPAKIDAVTAALLDDGAKNYRPTVDYGIEARLDPETKTVTGRARIVWQNQGSVPVRALWWHLYLNAFRNERSTFIRESGGEMRGDEMREDTWGWIEVTELSARRAGTSTAPPADLMAARTYEHPDDDNAEDRTVLRTPLPFAIGPGEQVELQVAFTSKLPYVFARSGYAHDFFMIAQWFPKLGVLQETFRPPGPGEAVARDAYGEPAWNCHQYHARSEFFADYGTFRVAMTVPAGYVVGATGRRELTTEGPDGAVTYEHVQERVHDFAWTADPRFVERTRRFTDAEVTEEERAEAAARLGLSPEDLRLGEVEVKALLQPEHLEFEDRYFAAVFHALKWFGLWYGAYPYEVLTLVDGPRGSGGAMGMEYPTLITGGVSWPSPDTVPRPESVTVHEFGHQYWYGLVGTNEFEESWLDEGFNTYSTGRVLDRAYGRFVFAPRVLSVPLTPWFSEVTFDQATFFRMGHMAKPDSDPVAAWSWRFLDARAYGVNSYPRPANVLAQLEATLGERDMARAMRLYHLRWRYRHPTAADFVAAAEEVSGRDLDGFFTRAVHTAGKVDYGIEILKSEAVGVPAGIFGDDSANPLVHREVSVEAAEDATEALEDEEARRYETEVLVMRHGDVPFAHTLEVAFTDGSTKTEVWDGRARWARYRYETDAKARSARLYAARPMLLDTSPSNDTRRVKPDRRVGLTWGAHVLYVAQTILQFIGGLL